MSETHPADDFDAVRPSGVSAELPDDVSLPPVEPPSAGFIVQLFVVPALIVAAVIGVYLLLAKMASSEVVWRELVADLRSDNTHSRWRGANGLAQLLEADSLRLRTAHPDPSQPLQPLSRDRDLAQELALTLAQELGRDREDPDHQRLLEYLIKSLGWMDVPEIVIPALTQAWEQTTDPFLHQQTLIALGVAAGRAHGRGQALDSQKLTDLLLDITRGEPGVLRHLATYDLGFLADPAAQARLRVLLVDADLNTRLNAAVGITRSGSTEALPIFEAILSESSQSEFDPQLVKTEAEAETYFERKQRVANALTAAASMRALLSAEQRAGWIKLVEPLTKVADAEVRHKAIETQHALEASDK
ncbi:MAG: HEAT repeat domain-containing protein [Planctomycetaceae bacterium]